MEPSKVRGRPRQTCGKSRCRRLNGAANAERAEFKKALHAEKLQTAKAKQAVTEYAQSIERQITAVSNALMNGVADVRRRNSLGPAEQATALAVLIERNAVPTLGQISNSARERADPGPSSRSDEEPHTDPT